MVSLTIDWQRGEVEYIELDVPLSVSKVITSDYSLEAGRRVLYKYIARPEFSRRRGNNTLVLTYRRDENEHPLYGYATITWRDGVSPNAKAYWKSFDGDEGQDGWARGVTVETPDEAFDANHPPISVIVKSRPGQAKLREALLGIYGKCAISGETDPDCLDAAHIVPVKAGGAEIIYNAILLRADLHRLFDAGRIWFEVRSDRALLHHNVERYKDLGAEVAKS